jgi:hypothetical protein
MENLANFYFSFPSSKLTFLPSIHCLSSNRGKIVSFQQKVLIILRNAGAFLALSLFGNILLGETQMEVCS